MILLPISSHASLVAMYGFENPSAIGTNETNPGTLDTTPYGNVQAGTSLHPNLGSHSLLLDASNFGGDPRGLRFPDSSNILNGSSSVTVSTFFSAARLPAANGTSNLIWIGRGGDDNQVRFGLQIFDVNKIRVIGRANDGPNASNAVFDVGITLNTLYHIAATVDVTIGKVDLYINGVLFASQTGHTNFTSPIGTFPNTNSNKATIGSNGAGNSEYFYGKMDDLRIYNEILSATDIADLASAAGLVPEPSTTLLTITASSLLLTRRRRVSPVS